MGLFRLKLGDTKPKLVVLLKDPPQSEGAAPPPHNLTGATGVKLRIRLVSGLYLSRVMTVDDAPTGQVSYQWLASDWSSTLVGTGTKADPITIGGLVVGPTLPLPAGGREAQMEYEVTGPGGAVMTFPNEGYDTLRVWDDLGDA